MGWFKKLRKRVEKVVKKAVKVVAPIPSVVVDVAKGKDFEEAVKDVIEAPVEVAKEVAGAKGDIEGELDNVFDRIIDGIAGDEARKVFQDLRRVAKPVDDKTAEAFLGALNKFIETGDFNYLNPLVSLIAGEIQEARDQYWSVAKPIPMDVVNAMPTEIQNYAKQARHIDVSQTSGLSLPALAANHLKKVRAIVAVDLIFFRGIPSGQGNEDLHFWAHEIFHVKQYSDTGLEGFVKKYIGEEAGFRPLGSEGNALEVEADLFACRLFPIPNPAYLSGPCP